MVKMSDRAPNKLNLFYGFWAINKVHFLMVKYSIKTS